MVNEPLILPPICLVDDSRDDLFFACRLLEQARVLNPLVTFARSEQALMQLLSLAAAHRLADGLLPAAIVLDGSMPKLDGFALLRELRLHPAFAATRMVMLSGSERFEDKVRAIDGGADAYLVKFPVPKTLADALLQSSRCCA